MGNTLPCLVQGTTALPAMKPKKRLYSLKLLMKALHKSKKRPCDNRSKITISKSPPEAGEAAKEGAGVKSMAGSMKASPRRAAAGALGGGGGRGGGGGQRKGVVRVKVVLTKEEAARLLSLTVKGHKTAAQIVAEIKRMEARRAAANTAWRPELASIPEESS